MTKAKHDDAPHLNEAQQELEKLFDNLEIEIKKATGNAYPDSLSYAVAQIKASAGLPLKPAPDVHI